MNRFFRSALFPLIIIVALAWLAMSQLTGNDGKSQKVTYSQLRDRVNRPAPQTPQSDISFDPKSGNGTNY